jgi:DNA repair photolyase
VLLAPILPHLTDSTDQLEALVDEVVAAGATSVSGIALHLRPGAREWFFEWLRRERADLVPAYERLYARGANAPKEYRTDLQTRLRSILSRRSLQRVERLSPPPASPPAGPQAGDQAQLF